MLLLAWLLSSAAIGADLNARQHVLVVGSSTAYPIIAAAAEHISRRHEMPAPVIESTGTGGGFKLFCTGQGSSTPDIAMASRRMKDSERNDCLRNQVNDIREIKIGYDGIVIATTKAAPAYALRKHDLYRAMAREVPATDGSGELVDNPYLNWRQIDAALPDQAIRVLGPPPTSGTRDMLVERVFEAACLTVPALQALHAKDRAQFTAACHALREDGAFVEAGENDARLVRKLLNDPGALGIIGYSFLDQNRDRLRAARIDGIAPTFESIDTGEYPLTRPLYVYVKPQHARFVHDLDTFVDALVSSEVSGADGYLAERGLIPLKPAERAAAGARH